MDGCCRGGRPAPGRLHGEARTGPGAPARDSLTAVDDQALVAAAQDGDRAALDVLLRRHHDRLYALCRRLTGNDADAADANQEALMAIVRGLARFDGRSSFSTWSYRVATNACLDELRRRRRRPDPGLPEEERALPADDRGGPPRLDDEIAVRMAVDEALCTLPMTFRAAVVLRDLCGLDYAEIAEVLGVPTGTVRSRIARGRAALAQVLGNPPAPTDRPSPRP
ncbi:MAG: RNA polymerase sigma factor [Acidimicrobiia bacterium]